MFDKAIYEYNMASKLKPAYPEAHYNLGVVYWKQNNWNMVVKEFEEALRINPGYEQARRFLPEARRKAGIK
jgi:tetratricopeptide (TPR) repeat protein